MIFVNQSEICSRFVLAASRSAAAPPSFLAGSGFVSLCSVRGMPKRNPRPMPALMDARATISPPPKTRAKPAGFHCKAYMNMAAMPPSPM